MQNDAYDDVRCDAKWS